MSEIHRVQSHCTNRNLFEHHMNTLLDGFVQANVCTQLNLLWKIIMMCALIIRIFAIKLIYFL